MSSHSPHPLKHAAVYLVARGVPGIVAFAAIPLFTWLLTPAQYGQYALIMAAVMIGNALCFQWLRLSLLRYLPACQDDPVRLKSTLATITGGLITALALIGAILCLLPPLRGMEGTIATAWGLLAAQAMFELCGEYARSMLRPGRFMLMQMTRSIVGVGLGVVLVLTGWGWFGPVAGLMVGMLLGVALVARGDWSDVRPLVDRKLLTKLSMYGLPLSLTVALAVVISTSDRFLIDRLIGRDATGLYAVAFDFTTNTLTLLMLAINMAVFPMAVRALERDGADAARRHLRDNVAMLAGVGLPAMAGLIVLAPGLANSFLGTEFREAAVAIIPLVAIGSFLECLKAYHFDAAFQFAHRTILQVWIVLVVAVVNIGLNLLFIPRWGINGSAGASVMAYVLSIGLTAGIGRRYFAVPIPLAPVLQALVSAGVMGAVLYPFRDHLGPWSLAWQVPAGMAVYGLMLLGVNFMGSREALLRRLGSRMGACTGPAGALPEAQWVESP